MQTTLKHVNWVSSIIAIKICEIILVKATSKNYNIQDNWLKVFEMLVLILEFMYNYYKTSSELKVILSDWLFFLL